MHTALPLGRLLVTSGLLTQQALDEVLAVQKTDGRRLGELLAERGLVRPHQLAQFLSHQLACPWVSLERVEVAREAVDCLPRDVALKHHMVPVHLRTSKGATALYVAMDDPTDDVALSEASVAATMPVKPMIALTSEIRALLERLYGTATRSTPPSASASNSGPLLPPSRQSRPSFTNEHTGLDAPPLPPPPPVGRQSRPSFTNEAAGSPPPPPARPAVSSTPPLRERSPSYHSVPPTISLKEETPRPGVTRPTKPPVPKPSRPPPREEPSILDEIEVIEEGPSSLPTPTAKVIVVDGPSSREAFFENVREVAARLGADAVAASVADVKRDVDADLPCAIVVVPEEVYESGRSGLDHLALELGAQLIVSSSDFTRDQLSSLLEGAIKRWRRSSYEKGTVLEGRYELLRDLGGRVLGSRWEVRHLRTARRSVLKVGVRAAHDETDAEAVRREQVALARFQHPGAIDLRDAGNTELGDPFLVVEMLEGRTLEGLVTARGALGRAEATALVRQLADVLVTAHEAGVVHSAVRPENVLVVRDAWGVERVKLVHWEAATLLENAKSARAVTFEVGADISGVGACAFFALLGRARREDEEAARVDLPPEWSTLVGRTLLSNAARFTAMRDLVGALDKLAPDAASSHVQLLQANPERRGGTLQPASREPVKGEELAMAMGAPRTPTTGSSELRRHPRAPYRTPVRVEVSGMGAIDGRSEDVSERGLFVVMRTKIPDGAKVTVRFALPIDGRVVSESGTVRWSRAQKLHSSDAPSVFGVELTAPTAETARQIGRYVSFMASGRGDSEHPG